jgi:hypothetical protein
MHQYQADTYPKVLKDLQAANPILQQAQAADPAFWDKAFAALA